MNYSFFKSGFDTLSLYYKHDELSKILNKIINGTLPIPPVDQLREDMVNFFYILFTADDNMNPEEIQFLEDCFHIHTTISEVYSDSRNIKKTFDVRTPPLSFMMAVQADLYLKFSSPYLTRI